MYNSDGYVLIDLTGVDITKTNQHLTGIYNRVLTVIDINKLALVINAGDLTPMAAVVHKKLNYYVINTPLYIFTINSNDIIMIEEAGEATVDVAIVPTLLDGVKIADFTIGAVEGSLYAPEQQSEINDNITTDYTTWSSAKINTELSDKAEAADVYTKAQVDTALALKADTSDIPTKTSELLNDSGFITSAQVPTIDDSSVSSSSVWSSYKTSGELATKANAAETTAALALKANSADVYTKSEVDTALANKADNSAITDINTRLGGYNFLTWTLEGNGGSTTTPGYSEACIIIIGRGASGLYYGHWSGVNALVIAQNHNVTFASNPNKITITNNGSTTDRITIIYK